MRVLISGLSHTAQAGGNPQVLQQTIALVERAISLSPYSALYLNEVCMLPYTLRRFLIPPPPPPPFLSLAGLPAAVVWKGIRESSDIQEGVLSG